MDGEVCFGIPSLYTIIGLVAVIFMLLIYQFIQERDFYKAKYNELLTGNRQSSEKADDLDALINPLRAPLRKNIYTENNNNNGVMINIPTQGEYTTWHQVGILRQKVVTNPELMMPLFGRRLEHDNWEYYTTNHLNTSLKIPLSNTKEIYDDDDITVPGYDGLFVVEIYEYDKPRYLPNVF